MHGFLGPEALVASAPGRLVLQNNSTGWTSVYRVIQNHQVMEIGKLTPISRVSRAMAHPSIPASQCAKFHMPSFFSRASLLQGPTGIIIII